MLQIALSRSTMSIPVLPRFGGRLWDAPVARAGCVVEGTA